MLIDCEYNGRRYKKFFFVLCVGKGSERRQNWEAVWGLACSENSGMGERGQFLY